MTELTQRQLQILCLVAKGYRSKQIAAPLRLTDEIVRHEIRNIMARLGVDSRVAMVVKAIKLGLLKAEDIDV